MLSNQAAECASHSQSSGAARRRGAINRLPATKWGVVRKLPSRKVIIRIKKAGGFK